MTLFGQAPSSILEGDESLGRAVSEDAFQAVIGVLRKPECFKEAFLDFVGRGRSRWLLPQHLYDPLSNVSRRNATHPTGSSGVGSKGSASIPGAPPPNPTTPGPGREDIDMRDRSGRSAQAA
jgi:hypothetical protein